MIIRICMGAYFFIGAELLVGIDIFVYYIVLLSAPLVIPQFY